MPDDRPRTFSAMFIIPQESTAKKVWFFYTWPIQLLLTTLVPSPKVHRKLYPLTFVLCILLIGANSYLVYWMVAIIGHTISIPESVMGMTLLAGGGCLPEAISCVILIRRGELTDGFLIQWQCIRCGVWLPDKTIPLSSLSLFLPLCLSAGQGGFGISNSLGANSLAILMSLGVPWFIKTMIGGAGSTDAHVIIQSYGVEFTIGFLLLAVITMYIILTWSHYRLRKSVGGIMITAYVIFIILAILVELEVIFPSGNVC